MPTALITGASSGIGLEFAKVLANDGYDLVLVARREQKLQQLKSELAASQKRVEVIPIDLSQIGAGKELYRQIHEKKLDCDVLINNAGFGQMGFFHEIDWQVEQEMIQLNILTLTELSKIFVKDRLAKDQRGNLVNVASTAAFQAGPLMAVYYATKAYVLSFSEAIANELNHTQIKVTALCPGPTKSEFQERAALSNSKLFSSSLVPDSAAVAQYGYEAMKAGKTVAVHGVANRVGAFSNRLMTRKAMTNIVRVLSDKMGRGV
ncbi:MAG: SDR family NAD(P)-dependent oxidoreductase [Oligoflexus sp.]